MSTGIWIKRTSTPSKFPIPPACPLAADPVHPCNLPIDTVIKCSDGGYLGAHSENLSTFSAAFPSARENKLKMEDSAYDLRVLSENKGVLSLLLKFMHHAPQPKVQDVDMDTLEGLAEAAEKYSIYSATQVCRLAMEMRMRKSALSVLNYALQHKYKDLIDSASMLTVNESIPRVHRFIKDDKHFRAWVLWNHRHEEIKERIEDMDEGIALSDCSGMRDFQQHILEVFERTPLTGPEMYQNWRGYWLTCPCNDRDRRGSYDSCIQQSRDWLSSIRDNLSNNPLTLKEFLDDI